MRSVQDAAAEIPRSFLLRGGQYDGDLGMSERAVIAPAAISGSGNYLVAIDDNCADGILACSPAEVRLPYRLGHELFLGSEHRSSFPRVIQKIQ